MTGGDFPLTPSWEQLLTGADPSFRGASPLGGWRGLARHGRGDGCSDDELLDPADIGLCTEDDEMGWREAVVWTLLAAGVAAALTSRLGGILH